MDITTKLFIIYFTGMFIVWMVGSIVSAARSKCHDERMDKLVEFIGIAVFWPLLIVFLICYVVIDSPSRIIMWILNKKG